MHADADVTLALSLYHDRPLALQLISTEMADSMSSLEAARCQIAGAYSLYVH